MKCPGCKKIIPVNANKIPLKCPFCGARTGLLCKNCQTVNPIKDFICSNCNAEILKSCPECKCDNLPEAEVCRKCGLDFITPAIEIEMQGIDEDIEIVETPQTDTAETIQEKVQQTAAKNIIEKGILSEDKKIFSISGSKGIGKTVVFKSIVNDMKNEQLSWIYGKCTSVTQLTSGGLIQDILLNLFNLPNFCINNARFKKDASKFFKNEFKELSEDEIFDLINFLYPSNEGIFENIVSSKINTFSLLNKVFDKIIALNKFVIVIDNFSFIDGFSYEFLYNFIQKENVWENLKLLLMNNEYRPSKGYFYYPNCEDDVYLDINLSGFEKQHINMLVDDKEKNIEGFPKISDEEKETIFFTSRGNPAFIENALCLRFETQMCDQKFELPDTFTGLIEYRLGLLAYLNPKAYEVLIGSSILGDKINLNLIKEIYELNDKDFQDILFYLEKMDYISPLSDLFYEFKNTLIWETIFTIGQKDANFQDLNKKIFNFLANFTLNSYAIFGVIAQNLKELRLAFDIWTKTAKLAAYIGDINLYIISQKQCLALLNEFDDSETIEIRYNISERLGKLLANSNPEEAIEYLPDAVANAQTKGDIVKEIELLAYLSSSCRATGNYYGEVECVDNVLVKTPAEQTLEVALLKTTKLQALLNIGNCGQIINMIDNEIMPVFDEYFKNTKIEHSAFVYESWIKTYLILANTLTIQGNDRGFEILTILFDIIERYNIQDDLFICKCKLALALANTIKGDIKASEKTLEEVLKLYRTNSMDSEAIIRWNMISIINNFTKKNYNDLREDLFNTAAFAENNGDNFTKNVLKVLLGKILKDNGQVKQAIDIYNEQIAYFAKEKIALGALLTWYLVSDATLYMEGAENALEIATQALEVAQNPKIDNYIFIILLKTVIAEASITLSDFETAKNHIESAILMAKKFHMNDILSRLYLLYGKYFQELGLVKSPKQKAYLEGAAKIYAKASEIVQKTKNNYIHTQIQKAQNVLKSFCRMNNITLSSFNIN